MRILGAYSTNAAGYYRMTAPFSVLNYTTEHQFKVDVPTADMAGEYDVLWLQQHADAMAEIVARAFKDAGKWVVYDVDDWIFGMPPSWPAYDYYYVRGKAMGKEALFFHERMLRLADLVTTTTVVLAKKLTQFLGIDRVVVLPNCVLQGDWDLVIPAEARVGKTVLGWFGTGNHWDDWSEIVDAVDKALEATDGHLALIGAPDVAKQFPDSLTRRTSVHPLVPFKQFREVRRLITAFDVGLAWCTDRLSANSCRSPLKAIQYGAAGVPVVASANVYGEVIPADVDNLSEAFGLTTASPDTLKAALSFALNDINGQSRERADRWQQRVWREHTYETQSRRWLNALELMTGEEL